MTSSKHRRIVGPLRPLSATLLASLLAIGTSTAQPPVEERSAVQPAQLQPGTAAEQVAVSVNRFPLPWPNAVAQQLTVGTNGKLWFVERSSGSLASFDPQARQFERIQLGAEGGTGQLLIDAAGRIWLAPEGADYVGVVDRGSERVAKIPLARYPGLRVALLASGERSDTVWFSAADRPALGALKATGQQFELQPLPGLAGAPASLVVAGDGAVWLALAGSSQVARFDPHSGALSTLALPFTESRASQLLVLGDRVAVIDRERGTLGLLDPRTGAYLEYPVPLSGELLTASDGRQRVWLVSTGRDAQLASFDAGTRRFDGPRPVGVPVDGHSASYDQQSGALWLYGDGHLVQLQLQLQLPLRDLDR